MIYYSKSNTPIKEMGYNGKDGGQEQNSYLHDFYCWYHTPLTDACHTGILHPKTFFLLIIWDYHHLRT